MDRLERIEGKLDRIELKLDKYMEVTIETKAVAANNRASIRIILVSLLGAIGATLTYVVRYFMKF